MSEPTIGSRMSCAIVSCDTKKSNNYNVQRWLCAVAVHLNKVKCSATLAQALQATRPNFHSLLQNVSLELY